MDEMMFGVASLSDIPSLVSGESESNQRSRALQTIRDNILLQDPMQLFSLPRGTCQFSSGHLGRLCVKNAA